MTTDLITLTQVLAAADEVTRERPDELNPMNGLGLCIYTDPDDPERHCLGGTVLLRLGCELPAERESVNATPSRLRFEGYVEITVPGAALLFVRRLQEYADTGNCESETNDRRLAWRQAYDRAVASLRRWSS